MAVILAFFELLLAVVVLGQVQDVFITPPEAVRRIGEDLRVLCKVPYAVDSCRMEVGNVLYRLKPEQQEGDVVYAGNGLDSGECGAEIRRIREDWNGNVTCYLPSRSGPIEVKNTMQLIVARAPSPPLLLGPEQSSYGEGERLQLQCVVKGGRPAANLSWYIDEEPLTMGLHAPVTIYDPATGLSSISQNLTRTVGPQDSGRRLLCQASHAAWEQPVDAARQIIVNFPPRRAEGEGSAITIFGLALGEPGRLNVTVRASPQPAAQWTVGGERLASGQSSADGTIAALPTVPLGNNLYNITLLLSRVTKEDVERAYYLRVSNDLGRDEYAVTITTMAEPAGVELDAGAIVGIVVGVLALLLAVFLVVFARATHRWCFAVRGRSREDKNSGESSDTESAAVPAAASPRSKLAALGAIGARVRAALPKPRDKGAAAAENVAAEHEDTGPAAEEKKGVVYAELALGERTPPAAPTNPPPADYAEIVYPKDGEKPTKPEKE